MQEIKIFYNNGEIVTINDFVGAYPEGSWFTIIRAGNKMEHHSSFSIERVIVAGDD